MKLILALACLVGAVLANRPCGAPYQLTFRAAQAEYDQLYRARYYGQYDRTNERAVFFEEEEEGTIKKRLQYLFLHAEHRGYRLDYKTKRCKSFDIGKFRPWEVPKDAKYHGEFEIGGPEEGVSVDQWSDHTGRTRETWMGDFSIKNCYPVHSFLLEEKNFNKTIMTAYYDMVKGVVHPDLFKVPAECQHADNEPMDMTARYLQSMTSHTLYN